MENLIFSEREFQNRIQNLRTDMFNRGIDCIYLPYGPNQYYVTGLHARPTAQSASRVLAAIVPYEGDVIFIVPDRRKKLVEKASWVSKIQTWTFPDNPAEAVVAALIEIGLEKGRIGVDSATPYEEVENIGKLLPEATIQSYSNIFQKVRLVKSSAEIEIIRQTGKIAVDAIKKGLEAIKEGATEANVAAAIYDEIVYRGGEVFEIAVIAGKHKGFPERTGQHQIIRNQLVLIFPKFSYHGYFVDITRMAIVGELSEEEKMIEKAIIEAYEKSVEIAKPGITFDEVDKAGRSVLDDFGIAQYFTHGIGHGLGLATHEPPYIGISTKLDKGMIFTIEPSIYRPNQPAMRIEDTFVVTDEGSECLTQFPIYIHRQV